jgi:putative sigma-54 modulation protein
MNLNLTGNHVEITPAMREYVTTKINKITRHFDHVIDVSVILSVEKHVQKAEANVHVKGKDIFVEADGDNMYASIDSLIDKLDRQVLKYKEKNLERRNQDSIKHHDLNQTE